MAGASVYVSFCADVCRQKQSAVSASLRNSGASAALPGSIGFESLARVSRACTAHRGMRAVVCLAFVAGKVDESGVCGSSGSNERCADLSLNHRSVSVSLFLCLSVCPSACLSLFFSSSLFLSVCPAVGSCGRRN